jgi:hypothetical protein
VFGCHIVGEPVRTLPPHSGGTPEIQLGTLLEMTRKQAAKYTRSRIRNKGVDKK